MPLDMVASMPLLANTESAGISFFFSARCPLALTIELAFAVFTELLRDFQVRRKPLRTVVVAQAA